MLCTPELSLGNANTKNGHTPFLGFGANPIPGQPPDKYLVCLWLVRQLFDAMRPIY